MKVDVSRIEGYAEMSAEDKLKALEAYEFEEPKLDTGEITKLKTALSKSNSEAAEYKRQLREKQTEAEKAEAERAEREKAAEEERVTLKKMVAVMELEKQYLAAGYSAELATASAKAQADGDTETVMKNQIAFLESERKRIEAEALKNQPNLSKGNPPSTEEAEKREYEQMRKWAGL